MKVTSVAYRRVMSDGNYGNRQVELRADLEEADTPGAVLAVLKATADKEVAPEPYDYAFQAVCSDEPDDE